MDFEKYILSPFWNPETQQVDEVGDRQFRFDDPRKYAKAHFYQNGKVITYEDTGISYAPFHEHKFSKDILRVNNDKVFFVYGIETHLEEKNIVYQFVVNTKAMEEAQEEWYEKEVELVNKFHEDISYALCLDPKGEIFLALLDWVYSGMRWICFREEEHINEMETKYITFEHGFDLLKRLPQI
jgi:hypothetical protein